MYVCVAVCVMYTSIGVYNVLMCAHVSACVIYECIVCVQVYMYVCVCVGVDGGGFCI